MKNIKFIALAVIVVIILCFIISSSNSDTFTEGKRKLEKMGYTDVRNTGYESFCCGYSRDNVSSVGFVCKDKQGNIIKGCFCSGPLLPVTVNFK